MTLKLASGLALRIASALLLASILFVYIGCGAFANAYLEDMNRDGRLCVDAEISHFGDVSWIPGSDAICKQWEQEKEQKPWYYRLYDRAWFGYLEEPQPSPDGLKSQKSEAP